MMIKSVKRLTTSQLLQLRESYRTDIRSLDDLNFKIISAISTVTLGILAAGTALKNPDLIAFFFAGIVIVNCLAMKMLLKNRISVLEKTWYVCYLESKLPSEYRQYSPFGFEHFAQTWPKETAYVKMISVHETLILVGFAWSVVSIYLFQELSQHFLVRFVGSIFEILGIASTDVPIIVFHLDHLIWLGISIVLILAAYIYKFKVKQAYEKKWKSSIWAKRPDLLDSIKKQYIQRSGEEEPEDNL